MASSKLNQKGSNILFIKYEDLLLDNENPRFAGEKKNSSQKDLAKKLWEEMYLEEIIVSLAVNGYYQQEPLLVVSNGKGKYTVVEGNRRLASLKILLDPNLAKYVGAKNIPEISKEASSTLTLLPVIKYNDRKELWSYLSFRHVNGPRGWSSISKAEFIANLHLKMGIDFDSILRSTGDRNRTSIKMFNGLMLLRQGEKITRFKREDFNSSKFYFSHLYTLIQYPDTKKFLGIQDLDSSVPFNESPVPEKNKKQLEELLIWIFGSKSLKVSGIIKSQNPDLRMLDDIIASPEALNFLRETKSLVLSHELTAEEDRRLETFIIRADSNIRNAKSLEDSYKGDEMLLTKIKNISEISKEMQRKMTAIFKKNSK